MIISQKYRSGLMFELVCRLPMELCGKGVNFALLSRYARRVRLELFDHPEDSSRPPG